MIDLFKILLQAKNSHKAWRERVRHCKFHGKENLQQGSCYYTEEDKLFTVPPLTFAGFLGSEAEWYFFKKEQRKK